MTCADEWSPKECYWVFCQSVQDYLKPDSDTLKLDLLAIKAIQYVLEQNQRYLVFRFHNPKQWTGSIEITIPLQIPKQLFLFLKDDLEYNLISSTCKQRFVDEQQTLFDSNDISYFIDHLLKYSRTTWTYNIVEHNAPTMRAFTFNVLDQYNSMKQVYAQCNAVTQQLNAYFGIPNGKSIDWTDKDLVETLFLSRLNSFRDYMDNDLDALRAERRRVVQQLESLKAREERIMKQFKLIE